MFLFVHTCLFASYFDFFFNLHCHGEWEVRGLFVCCNQHLTSREKGMNHRSMVPAGDSWERQLSIQSTWNTVDQESLSSSPLSCLASCLPSLRFFLLRGEAERETLGTHFPSRESECGLLSKQLPLYSWLATSQRAWKVTSFNTETWPKKKKKKKAGGGIVLPERADWDFSHIPQSFN